MKERTMDGKRVAVIFFEKRVDAIWVLTQMKKLIAKDRFVTVGDYYDLASQEDFIGDDRFGWNDLTGVVAVKTGGRYILILPDVIARPEE